MQDSHTAGADRAAYYARIAKKHMAPLWESLHNLVPREPAPRCVPAIWKYEDVRADVMASGALISAEEAVRRVLILKTPACPARPASRKACTPACS